jgi:hypothetical protein
VKPTERIWAKSVFRVVATLAIVIVAIRANFMHLGSSKLPITIAVILVAAASTPIALDFAIAAAKVRLLGHDPESASVEQSVRRHWKDISDECGLTASSRTERRNHAGRTTEGERCWRTRITKVRHTTFGLELEVRPPGKGINSETVVGARASLDHWLDQITPMPLTVNVAAQSGSIALISRRWRDPLSQAVGFPDELLPPGWQS